MRACNKQRSKIPLGTKGRTSILSIDILLSLEYHDLPDAQAKALLKSPSPLADIFKDWEHKETSYMEDIWQTVEERAKTEAQKIRRKKEQER